MPMASAAPGPAVGCLPSASTTVFEVVGSPAGTSLYVVDLVFKAPEGFRVEVGALR